MGKIKGKRVHKLAKLIGTGSSVAATSREMNLSQITVNKYLKDNKENPDFRGLIEYYTRQHYNPEMLGLAHDNVHDVLKSKEKDLPWSKLKYQASKDLLQGAGIYPSDSPVAVNILLQQNINWNSTAVKDVLGEHYKGMTFEDSKKDEKIVEAEVEDNAEEKRT